MTWPMMILKEPGGTAPNKVLRDKAFIAARNLSYNGYQQAFASMVFIFLIKCLQVWIKTRMIRIAQTDY